MSYLSAASMISIDGLAAEHQPGRALPQAAYTDPDLYAAELELVFGRGWVFVTSTAELAAPRAHYTWSVGPDSVILTRDDQGALHAHHNVCRHRGSRIQPDGSGCGGKILACGYHGWAYHLDGSFRGAPHLDSKVVAAERDRLGLGPVHVREVGGLIFVCFAQQPPSFEAAQTALTAQLTPHRPDLTRVVARHHYTVRANWKILIENNRECYHCLDNHAEFCLSNYELGMSGDARTNTRYESALAAQRAGWAAAGLSTLDVSFPGGDFFRVARLPLKPGYLTESLSGQLVAPLLGDLASAEAGSVRIIGLPNLWAHVNADYVMTTRLTPIDVDTTAVDVVFLVRADAALEAVDVEAVEAVWVATSEQDWALCETNSAGIRSRAYLPGPLSTITEGSVVGFHGWWWAALGRPELAAACAAVAAGALIEG
jgi:Rieske 2Fe-2S family protein